MPTPKFLKLYPTQKKRAYATGIVVYNRNIFFRTAVFSSRSGKWLPSPFNLLFNIRKRLCLHSDFLIRLQALPPALITNILMKADYSPFWVLIFIFRRRSQKCKLPPCLIYGSFLGRHPVTACFLKTNFLLWVKCWLRGGVGDH